FYVDPLTGAVIFYGEDGVRDVVTVHLDAAQTNLVVDWSQPDALPVPRSGSSSFPLATTPSLTVNLYGGNDDLILDHSNGLVALPDFIFYDGGTGIDTLQLIGTTAVTSDVYTVGAEPGSGNDVMSTAAATQAVFFTNLEPVFDLVAGPLVVTGTNA